jgi:hypothetical protein
MKRVFAILLCAASVALAQTSYAGLPAGAFIVEVKELPATAHPNRALVLWMLHPKKHERAPISRDNPPSCPDLTQGSYFDGPTRISLVDTAAWRVVNTISLGYWEKDSFDVPYRIQPAGYFPGYSHVPGPLRHGEGKPELLYLRDYNGDGDALDARHFCSIACNGMERTLHLLQQEAGPVFITGWNSPEGTKKSLPQMDPTTLFLREPMHPGLLDI